MNALVIYYSKFGNTQKIAETIAGALEPASTVRMLGLGQLAASELEGYDLVVLGSPTHRMNLPEVVQPVLDALPKRIFRGASVAAFDTSYKMSPFLARFTAAKKLARRLRKLGGRQIVPPETFFVMHQHEGPLYEGEIERAKAWAANLLGQMSS